MQKPPVAVGGSGWTRTNDGKTGGFTVRCHSHEATDPYLIDDAYVRYRVETLRSPRMSVTNCGRRLAAGRARRTRI